METDAFEMENVKKCELKILNVKQDVENELFIMLNSILQVALILYLNYNNI